MHLHLRSMLLLALVTWGLMPLNSLAAEVEVLIEQFKNAADPGAGITEVESKIAEQLQAVGADAIPPLLSLLRDDNEQVRAVASYTLRDIKGLTEEHLPALIESRRRGDGWIPPAIARIGTPAAVEFLIAELVRERQINTQLTWAITKLGSKAVPQLVHVYQSESGWDDELKEAVEFVFKEMGETAADAIDPLLKIASDDKESAPKRARAASAVGAIGSPAERAVPELQKLRQHGDRTIQDAARSAIVNVGSADAVPILVEALAQTKDAFSRTLVLRDIASLRTRGSSAGPAVRACLGDTDWEVRVAAARALGYLGYKRATDDLIELLDRKDDWRLVFVAAESLGMLKAKRAAPVLSSIWNGHWYPPVCTIAERALDAIGEGTVSEGSLSSEPVISEFFEYEDDREKIEYLEPREWTKTRVRVRPLLDSPQTFMVRRKDGKLQSEEHFGTPTKGGYFIATDNGEWGGAIEFVDRDGNVQLIAPENAKAIYDFAGEIFAVTGLAHGSLNRGFIQKVRKIPEGKWTVEKWRALPGARGFPGCWRTTKCW